MYEDLKINRYIAKNAFPIRQGRIKNCDLYASEKLFIAMANLKSLLEVEPI